MNVCKEQKILLIDFPRHKGVMEDDILGNTGKHSPRCEKRNEKSQSPRSIEMPIKQSGTSLGIYGSVGAKEDPERNAEYKDKAWTD